MRTTVIDKIIVFPANNNNTFAAVQAIDQLSYCNVQPYKTVVAVHADDPEVWKYSKPEKTFEEVKRILNRYGIPYKVKKMTF